MPLPTGAAPVGAERHLVVRIVTRAATPWAPAGHEVAWQQIELPRPPSGRRRRARTTAAPVRDGDTAVLTDGDAGWRATVDLASARLAALTLGGEPLLAGAPRAELWRGATDNDGLKLLPNQGHKPLARWQAWGLDQSIHDRAPQQNVEAGAAVAQRGVPLRRMIRQGLGRRPALVFVRRATGRGATASSAAGDPIATNARQAARPHSGVAVLAALNQQVDGLEVLDRLRSRALRAGASSAAGRFDQLSEERRALPDPR